MSICGCTFIVVDAQLDVKIADLELGYSSKHDSGANGAATDQEDDDDEDSLQSIISHTTLAEFYSSAMISPWQPPEVRNILSIEEFIHKIVVWIHF